VIEYSYQRYLQGGDFELLLYVNMKEGMIKHSVPFTVATNFIAQTMGPLPTFRPDFNYLSLFSSGLLFRALLTLPFWLGAFRIITHKEKLLKPILYYTIFEMVGLTISFEGLELRKSLMHFPGIYIIAFWYLSVITNEVSLKFGVQKKVIKLSFVIIPFVILAWNFRF
jgi:hypothetical protein